MDTTRHPDFIRTAAAVVDLFGDGMDDETFAGLVDFALAEADRRALAEIDPAPEPHGYVVLDGRRVYADGSFCGDY